MKRYFLLLLAAVTLIASCGKKGIEESEGSYAFLVPEANIKPSATSAVINGVYSSDPTRPDNAKEVGIRYAKTGETAEKDVAAAVLSKSFTVTLTDLSPQTSYTIRPYIKTTTGKVVLADFTRQFTTQSPNPEPNPEPDPDPDPEIEVNIQMLEASDITQTEAVLGATYSVKNTTESVTSVGFRYRKSGDTSWQYITAKGTSNTFYHTVSGLAAGTNYEATAWIKIGGKTYNAPADVFVNFRTLDPHPETSQFQWAELPVMTTMDNVSYATYYVSSNGQSDASPTTKGRVRNYTICYDEANHQPLWVAYPMHPWYDGGAGRNEAWQYGPYIPQNVQPNLSRSYEGEYSRGHMLASSDRQKTVAMNKQTFYYTNMSPQIQNEFNGGIWNDLEIEVQSLGFNCSDTLYVVTGAAFIGSTRTASDRDGMKLPVPTHYYKVLLSSKSGRTGKSISQLSASELRCVGFWLGHFDYGTKDKISSKEMTTVADIEAKTGFKFFPMLSEEAKSVKSSYKASDWGF
jgi:DNA/RNA endonuclease G (NUC1)